MALSERVVSDHIATNSARLKESRFPSSSEWPKRVFRHDPLPNVAQILNAGVVLSRAQSAGQAAVEAAALDIVNNSDRAHEFVRLYFRPRTPTQYHIEGIRKPSEYYHGAHAPTLGMLIFHAKQVLLAPGVAFSNCNMQRADVEIGNSDQFFSERIDFRKVYHQGWHGDPDITACRCAEILMPSPMRIEEALEQVCCRSEAERETLFNLLTDESKARWGPIIRVSDDLAVFDKRFAYTEVVQLSNDGVVAQFAARQDGRNVVLELVCTHRQSGHVVINFRNDDMPLVPTNGARRWIFQGEIHPGSYDVRINIDGCVSYEASLRYEEAPF